MPITTEKGLEITPGTYEGVVANTYIRPAQDKHTKKPLGYDYLTLEISLDVPGKEPQLMKQDFPARLSQGTLLGGFLKRVGRPIPEVGEAWDEKSLEGLKVRCTVVEDGQFMKIDRDSISPA